MVVIKSLVLTAIVVSRERDRGISALQVAWANYENAKLTREVDAARANELAAKAAYDQLKAIVPSRWW